MILRFYDIKEMHVFLSFHNLLCTSEGLIPIPNFVTFYATFMFSFYQVWPIKQLKIHTVQSVNTTKSRFLLLKAALFVRISYLSFPLYLPFAFGMVQCYFPER